MFEYQSRILDHGQHPVIFLLHQNSKVHFISILSIHGVWFCMERSLLPLLLVVSVFYCNFDAKQLCFGVIKELSPEGMTKLAY